MVNFMKKFSDWDREVSSDELERGEERYAQLINEAKAYDSESEIEARLNRDAAYRFAGEASDPRILMEKACEMFNKPTLEIARFLSVLLSGTIDDEAGISTLHFFYENLYDYAFLLNFINENIMGIFNASFLETDGGDLEYSASIAKMGMQAIVGGIFAVVHELLTTDKSIIPEIMNTADEDMTVYDIKRLIKGNYLLIERRVDFEPAGKTRHSDEHQPKHKQKYKKKPGQKSNKVPTKKNRSC